MLDTEMWVSHEDNLSMFVRQVTLQLGQDALGVCPQLPALNERFCGLHAFFAFLRVLSEEHKTIYCNIPEGILSFPPMLNMTRSLSVGTLDTCSRRASSVVAPEKARLWKTVAMPLSRSELT